MDAQFADAFPNRLDIAEIPGFDPVQPKADTGLCRLVTQAVQPFCERFEAVFPLISDKLDHEPNRSLKATTASYS